MRLLFIYLGMLFFINSCGMNPSPGVLPKESTIRLSGFTRSMLKQEKRIFGYVQSAGRFSIIDPVKQVEATSYTGLHGYKYATAFSHFDGFALFNKSNLRILSSSASREFPLNDWDYWDKAKDATALVFTNSLNSSAKVIKHLVGAQWQEANLKTPWETATPSQLVTLLNDDGTRVVQFNPEKGKIALFKATSKEKKIATSSFRTCNIGLINQSIWTGISLNSLGNKLLLSNAKGFVSLIDLSLDKCPSEIKSVLLSKTTQILGIQKPKDGLFLASSEGGLIFKIDISTTEPILELRLNSKCNFPLFPEELNTDEIAYICYKKLNPLGTREFKGSSPKLEIMNIKTNKRTQFDIAIAPHTNISIDPELREIFLLENNALGKLTTWNMDSKEESTKIGLFLKKILQKL